MTYEVLDVKHGNKRIIYRFSLPARLDLKTVNLGSSDKARKFAIDTYNNVIDELGINPQDHLVALKSMKKIIATRIKEKIKSYTPS